MGDPDELSWGYALWDQYDKISEHTEAGLEFTKKCADMVRDRIKIEMDYAKSLRRLKKQYTLKKADDDYNSFTTVASFNVFLENTDKIAREHEMLAERMQEEVFDKMRNLHRDGTNTRKQHCNAAAKAQHGYKEQHDQLEKARVKYEKAAKEGEIAEVAYKKVNDDMNATKAQVEKSKNISNNKNDLLEKAKGDYIIQIEKCNNFQHDYYHKDWPAVLNQFQQSDETRIELMKEFMLSHCTLHLNLLPNITEYILHMKESAESISPAQDSDLLMEERTKDNYPPEHQFLEYGSQRLNVPSNFSSNPSIRKTKKERKKTKIFGRMQGSESSESVNKEGLENLPPEKRKKKFEAKIHDIQSKIDVELKSRRGLEDILELYSQKPELGSPSAVEESRAQLDANSAALENLNEELFKYQCYLSALDPEKPPPEKPQSLSGLSNVNGGSGGDTVSITSGMSHKSHVNADSTDTFATAPPEETFNDEFYEVPDNDNEFPLPVSPGEGCTVLYDYVAQHEDELNIFCGETLTILEDNGTGWVKAQRTETEFGLVPGNYIEKY